MDIGNNRDAVRLAHGAISMTRWGFTPLERECRHMALDIQRQISELQRKAAEAHAKIPADLKETSE